MTAVGDRLLTSVDRSSDLEAQARVERGEALRKRVNWPLGIIATIALIAGALIMDSNKLSSRVQRGGQITFVCGLFLGVTGCVSAWGFPNGFGDIQDILRSTSRSNFRAFIILERAKRTLFILGLLAMAVAAGLYFANISPTASMSLFFGSSVVLLIGCFLNCCIYGKCDES